MCDSAATSVPTWLLCRAVFRPSCAQASDRTRDDFQARHTIEVEKLVELVRVLGGDLNVEPGECALQGGARRAADSQGVVVDSLKEFLPCSRQATLLAHLVEHGVQDSPSVKSSTSAAKRRHESWCLLSARNPCVRLTCRPTASVSKSAKSGPSSL